MPLSGHLLKATRIIPQPLSPLCDVALSRSGGGFADFLARIIPQPLSQKSLTGSSGVFTLYDVKTDKLVTKKPLTMRSFRIDDKELEVWRSAGAMLGLSLSEFLRRSLREKSEKVLASGGGVKAGSLQASAGGI